MSFVTELLPEPLPQNPLSFARGWLEEAVARAVQPNPNAMSLATASRDGRPSARIVLCKDIVADPGYLVFFTNYESRKGCELEANPRAAAVMHWDRLHRQVRIEGLVVQAPAAESDAYFASRPWQRRVGAWASAQSRPIASRAALIDMVAETARRFGAPPPGHEDGSDPGTEIPRPPNWGGYHLWADTVELWVEGESRIHDRACFTRVLEPAVGGFAPTPWAAVRLQP